MGASPTYESYDGTGISAIDPLNGSILWGPIIPSECSTTYSDVAAFGSTVSIDANDIVYATGDWNECHDGRLAAFEPTTGEILWDIGTVDYGYSPHPRQAPAINDLLKSVYFGSSYLFSVNMDTGTNIWVKPGGYYIGGAGIAIDTNNNIYYGTYDKNLGKITCFSGDGVSKWSIGFPTVGVRLVAILENDTIMVRPSSGILMALDNSDGHTLWEISGLANPVCDKSGFIFVQSTESPDIVSLTSEGQERWRCHLNGKGTPQLDFIDNSGLLYARLENKLYAIHRESGLIDWVFVADADLTVSSVLIPGGRILLSDANRMLYCLDTKLDYEASSWPVARYGNRRHTQKAWDLLPLPAFEDMDNDNIDDSWEREHGLNPRINDALFDNDGDGFSNMREYLSGTAPDDVNDIPPCEASFDSDQDADGIDLVIFTQELNRDDCSESDPCQCDLDGDGDVDSIDLIFFAEDFGRAQ